MLAKTLKYVLPIYLWLSALSVWASGARLDADQRMTDTNTHVASWGAQLYVGAALVIGVFSVGLGFYIYTQYMRGEDSATESFYKIVGGFALLGFIGLMISVFLPNVDGLPKPSTGLYDYLNNNAQGYSNDDAIHGNFSSAMPTSMAWYGDIDTDAQYIPGSGPYGSSPWSPSVDTDLTQTIPALDYGAIHAMVTAVATEAKDEGGDVGEASNYYLHSPQVMSMVTEMVIEYNYLYNYDYENLVPPTPQQVFDSIHWIYENEMIRQDTYDKLDELRDSANTLHPSWDSAYGSSLFDGVITIGDATGATGSDAESEYFDPTAGLTP